MFNRIKSKIIDMGTIKLLCESAENYALLDQQQEPGAEHFLLAALDLPDGTARHAFHKAGIEPDTLKSAIERQYGDALRSIGLIADTPANTPMPANPRTYRAAPSGQEMMKKLAADRKNHGPLLGAHVVGIVASMRYGIAARAIRSLGIDPAVLKSNADAVAEVGHNR